MDPLGFPAIIPLRNATDPELAAAARASQSLQAARRLADWLGEQPVNTESGWLPAHAQQDAAVTLGLITSNDRLTDETTSRLNWIYEIAFHARYIEANDHDHDVIRRGVQLSGSAERTDAQIVDDWHRALDALVAHGVEHCLPADPDPAPLAFDGIGGMPLYKLVEQRGTATVDVVSKEIAAAATDEMTPTYGRQQWTAWTAKHGEPTAAYLRLAQELGAVTIDGATVSITPLATSVLNHLIGAQIELLPAAAELTPLQMIICRLGMTAEAFGHELTGWLAARDPAEAVTDLLATAAKEDGAYLTTGVHLAASIEGDTEAAWRSAMSLPAIRPYAVAELNRRAGRDAQRDPLPGVEPTAFDAIYMASNDILTAYATGDPADVAEALKQAAGEGAEVALFERMWRSRLLVAEQALIVAGNVHPEKKIAKAARAASVKAASARKLPSGHRQQRAAGRRRPG